MYCFARNVCNVHRSIRCNFKVSFVVSQFPSQIEIPNNSVVDRSIEPIASKIGRAMPTTGESYILRRMRHQFTVSHVTTCAQYSCVHAILFLAEWITSTMQFLSAINAFYYIIIWERFETERKNISWEGEGDEVQEKLNRRGANILLQLMCCCVVPVPMQNRLTGQNNCA